MAGACLFFNPSYGLFQQKPENYLLPFFFGKTQFSQPFLKLVTTVFATLFTPSDFVKFYVLATLTDISCHNGLSVPLLVAVFITYPSLHASFS